MRSLLASAIILNSLDLIATALGIRVFGNREGNPLLADIAHHQWPVFVIIKGLLIPLLIVRLYHSRRKTWGLADAGLALVAIALSVAVGRWVGWIAAVVWGRGSWEL